MPTARFAPTTTCAGGACQCCACTITSHLARLVAQQPLRSHLLIRPLDHDSDLDPINLGVEVNPQPSTNADRLRAPDMRVSDGLSDPRSYPVQYLRIDLKQPTSTPSASD